MPDKPRRAILDTPTSEPKPAGSVSRDNLPSATRPPISDIRAAALLESLGEGVALVDLHGELIWANTAIDQLPENIRERLKRLCKREVEKRKSATIALAADTSYEISDLPPGSTAHTEPSRIYSVDFHACPGAQCKPTPGSSPNCTLAVVVRDQTRDRLTARRLRAVDRAGRDLLRIDREAVLKLEAQERLKQLETKIVGYAHDLLKFDHFAIRLLDKHTNKLELIISYGLPPEAAELDVYASETGSGIAGWVAAKGESFICGDALDDNRFLALCEGARSSLVVPMKQFGQVVGVMDVESLTPNAFTGEDLRFTRIFARSVAMAIHLLDLLVAERSTTNKAVSGQMAGEIREPLDDIIAAIGNMRSSHESDTIAVEQLDRILKDVESIKSRTKALSAGPQTLLGVEQAMVQCKDDPIINGLRVLIADDTAQIRRLIGDVLRKRNAEVIICESGSEAIERLRVMDGQRLDLVLSDISMKKPNGEPDRNGYEVFAAAKRRFPDVPVILMTGFGYDPHHSIVRASQEGLAATLFKPFQVERLLTEIRKAVTGDGKKK
ncbi:MAG: response regulator [Phycisphaeraceae bacterium]|nr:response regulator [Phycisphaerales bacterium]MCB9860499.1 response regulator [Phycisphaeraceae bacterium]